MPQPTGCSAVFPIGFEYSTCLEKIKLYEVPWCLNIVNSEKNILTDGIYPLCRLNYIVGKSQRYKSVADKENQR